MPGRDSGTVWGMSFRSGLAPGLGALLAGLACAGDPDAQMPRDELWKAIEAGQGPILIDVRSGSEYASGHVPGALHLPFRSVSSRVDGIRAERDEPVVVYCEHGPRAWWAARSLRSAGFQQVRYLEGHMSGWKRDGLPLESLPPERPEPGP